MGQFVLARNGIYEIYKDALFEGKVKAEFPLVFHKGYDTFLEPVEQDLEQELSLIFKKMRMDIFQQALEFIKAIWERDKIEVIVCFRYFEETGVWECFVPYQWNGLTSICYHPELTPSEATRIAADIHLHPPKDEHGGGVGTFHSSTDNLDERKNDGIFVVVSGFTPFTANASVVGVVRGKRFTLAFERFVDPSTWTAKPSYPKEWLERVKKLTGTCDGCKSKEDAIKPKSTPPEPSGRLVPKDIVEAWKKGHGSEGNGDLLKRFVSEWSTKTKEPKMFVCDNEGCRKKFHMPNCPHCYKSVGVLCMGDQMALALDELDCYKKLGEDKIKELTGEKDPVVKKPDGMDFFLIFSEEPCGDKCPYKDYPHAHTKSKDDLKAIFEEHVRGEEGDVIECKLEECLDASSDACNNGCVLATVVDLPVCNVPACKNAGHSWHDCNIKKAREVLCKKTYCPSPDCEKGGHTWESCDVRKKQTKTQTMQVYCGDAECLKALHAKDGCKAIALRKEGKELPMVITNNLECPGVSCSFEKVPHEHRTVMPKTVTTPATDDSSEIPPDYAGWE